MAGISCSVGQAPSSGFRPMRRDHRRCSCEAAEQSRPRRSRRMERRWRLSSTPTGNGHFARRPFEPVRTDLKPGAAEPFVDVPGGAATAAFSPDGRWLAYTSSESGPFEVYVRGFPDNGTKRLVSSGGGMMPMWSPNGKDIFYRTQDQRLMVASYSVKDGAFIADPPRPWSTQRLANIGMTGNVDLAPDGTRFVALMPANAAESRDTRGHYTLVTNFFDTVRRRLAASPK